MDDYNKTTGLIDNIENSKKPKSKIKILFRNLLILLFITTFISTLTIFEIIADILKKAPEIDPVNALYTLTESSVIVDESGNIIEQIHDPNENREIIKLSDIPTHVQNAFIAIEDHRYKEHLGIDVRRIASSLLHNFQVGDPKAQGASTITQQLVKNLYLTNEKSWERKIKEIYLALKVERILTKDQILEIYLNTIPLGQSSYGVQTASYTYFSKDVKDLTIAESALIAGAAKSTVSYAPYNRYSLDKIDNIPENNIIGYVDIGSVKYACVYNENAIKRQHIILERMLELGYINQYDYEKAMSEDMRLALNPGQNKLEDISTASMDYVKKKVIEDLIKEKGMDYTQAENYLFQGGLIITTTIDVDMQKSLENSYENFSSLYLGENAKNDVPVAQDWRYFKWEDGKGSGALDSNLNILNEYGQHIYFEKINILDDDNNLYLNKDEYSINNDGNLIMKSNKFDIYKSSIDITDCYTIDKNNNFVSHTLGALNIGSNYEILEKKGSKGSFLVTKDFTDKNPDMFKIEDDGTLTIPKEYFYFQEDGIVQPQSAAVIMDYRTGKIKAMVGGRNIEGSKLFNRATDAARQPGSTIKPLSVYLPALDLGYAASYVLNDIPRKNELGERWPKNWYEYRTVKYWGKITLRKSIEQSINTNAVNMLEKIGTEKSMEYMKKFNLINEDLDEDTFVSPQENPTHNDVNLASLALGGLTKGFSPLYMTAAYGAIANDGIYIEPIVYTKVVNKEGEIILNKVPETKIVATAEAASLMKDILRSTVYSGLSYKAKLPEEMGIEVAGKTGTTQSSGDFWYIGFSPYYICGIWVGNDNVQLKLSGDSGANARFWKGIMTPIHSNLPPAKFELNKNLIPINVCRQSGKLPSSLCSQDIRGNQVIREYFVPGTQPTDVCDIHVEVEICTASSLISSQYCPGDQVEKRVFVKRYTPSDADFQTEDAAFQVPETECTSHVKWHYDQWIIEENNTTENENTDEEELDSDTDEGNN